MEADTSGFTEMAFAAHRGVKFPGDETLLVKFYYETVPDKVKTELEGRPIFKEVPYIDIRQPGNRDWGVVAPATQADYERFPEHHRRFLARQEAGFEEGTPLAQWPGITRPQVEELKFFHCHTVEQLANMSDANTGRFHGIVSLKQKANNYLLAAKENSVVEALEAAKTRNAELEERLAKLEAMLDMPEAPKRRGRPPKLAEA
jgi:hypothetical protein